MPRLVLASISAIAIVLTLAGCPRPSTPKPTTAWTYLPSEDSIWGLTISDTADSGWIIGGGYNGSYDMYALKLDAFGNYAWDMAYSNLSSGGSHSELWRHEARGLRQTADGGYIMVGAGAIEGDTMPDQSYLLVKTDAAGNIAWSKTYAPENPYDPGEFCVNNEPAALEVTADGGYLVVGSSYVGGYNLASLLKTDAAGNQEVCLVINDNAKAYDQIITGGQQTDDGGYVLCGYSENGSPHGYLALLIKVDTTGVPEFSKTYQYIPDNHGAVAYSAVQTANGEYVLGGTLINNITKVINYGCWLGRTDVDGNLLWMDSLADADTIGYPACLLETPQGDILAGGADHVGAMTLAKFTSGGTHVWDFTMPDDTPKVIAKSMVLTADGGCVLVGSGRTGGPTVVAKLLNVFSVE